MSLEGKTLLFILKCYQPGIRQWHFPGDNQLILDTICLKAPGSGTRLSRASNWSHAQTVAWTPAHLAYIAKNANLSPAPVALKHQNTSAKSLWLDRTKRQMPHMYARWLTIGLVKEKVVQVY